MILAAPPSTLFARHTLTRTLHPLVLLVLLVGTLAAPVAYAAANVGFRGPSISGASSSPTGEKPESKLWWNDGFWWASMWDSASGDYHIFKLNPATNAWVDTGVPIDTRSNSRADTLWDGNKLYVASHVFSTSTGPTSSGNAAKLWRFSYNAANDQYTLDAGFPEVINTARSETLVIDKDSTGRLWATWVQQTTSSSGVYRVFVNRTTNGDTGWGTPFELSGSGATVNSDDISSLVAFVDRSGSTNVPKIGVMWSNQTTDSFYFAMRTDGTADTSWSTVVARSDTNIADDHVNLKSLSADDAGNVFAALKTSIDGSSSSSEQIFVLVRRSDGSWRYAMASSGAENQTRPILLIDRTNRQVYVFSSTESGGSVYYKQSSIANLSFASGLGTTFIQDGSSAELNNVTSTKQPVNCETGVVVLASNDTTDYYWHNYLPVPGCSGDTTPPTVSFTAPGNGATVSGTSVAVAANASDNVGVAGVQFKLDGANLGVEDTTAPYSLAWDSTGAGNGSHTLSAVARDAIGNTSTATITVNVQNAAQPPADTTPPTVSITTPSDGAPVSGTTVAIEANAADNVGVTSVQFTLDGSPIGEDSTAPYSLVWNSTAGANGNHTLAAVARDAAGLSSSHTITVDVQNAVSPPPSGTPTTQTFVADADVYVSQSKPTTSYGTNNQLQAVNGSSAKQSFLRFTVSGVPAGATVTEAKLRLVVVNDSTSGGVFNAISSNSWPENTTWNTRPAIDGVQLASLGRVATNEVVEIDVKPVVTGDGTYSFAFTLPAGNTNTLAYASRSYSTAAYRPQLIVTSQ